MRRLTYIAFLALACSGSPESIDTSEAEQQGAPDFVTQVEVVADCSRGPGYRLAARTNVPDICTAPIGPELTCYATAARTGAHTRSVTTMAALGNGYSWTIAWEQRTAAGVVSCSGSHLVTATN